MLVRRPARRRGQLALVTVFPLFTLLLLIAGVLNVTRVTATKMEQQNAADAVAHAAGVELARGLNAVTAINHLIGELAGLSALAMGFGGIELEDNVGGGPGKRKMVRLPGDARFALPHAQFLSGGRPPQAVEVARTRESLSGGAIGDSRKELLRVLGRAYWLHAGGGAMTVLPGFAPFGQKLITAALVIQKSVEFEWRVLAQLEELAKTRLLPLKWRCTAGMPDGPRAEWAIIMRLYDYCERVVERTPRRAEAAAEKVAERFGAVGSLYPNTRAGRHRLELPLEKDVFGRKSQLVRAMTPWVQYWRKPILEYGRLVLPLSHFARHYHRHSNDMTLNTARWQTDEKKTRLYRLKDLNENGPDKGREPWTRAAGSDLADRRFGVVGFALAPPPDVIGMPVFRQPQPDGLAAHAQVLLYNANPQDRPRRAKWQPVVGFDTLAWDSEVPEFAFGEEFGSDRKLDRDRHQPRIRLNWQTKLVPVTPERLTGAVGTQSPELNRILERLVTDRPLANTH